MFEHASVAVPGLVAVVLAIVRWMLGRALLRHVDDPLLPERLAAQNQVVGVGFGLVLGFLLITWPDAMLWTIPLALFGQVVAVFPLRKAIYQETWSVTGYLWFVVRFRAATLAFWLLLCALPWITSNAGRFAVPAAIGFGLLLLAWSRYFVAAFRLMSGLRPLTDSNLLCRFEMLVASAGIPPPRFEVLPVRGGVFVNAFALPSLRGSSVAFTETLLERFSVPEIVAICAHELAHLEYYNRSRLRRLSLGNAALIVTACALPTVLGLFSAGTSSAVAALWAGAIVVGVAAQVKRRRRNETASDVRAVALTGDPETLARALTKLHTIARVPRRWDQHRESQSTHPSLARRIRSIHAEAGSIAAPSFTPATFLDGSGSIRVTFDRTGLLWNDGANEALVPYASLVDVRLHASLRGRIQLVAIDSAGHKRRMSPLRTEVAAIQLALDAIDGQLSDPPARPFSALVTRLAAGLVCGLAMMFGQTAFAFASILAALVPASPLLAGGGAAGVVAAVLLLTTGNAEVDPGLAVFCAALAAGLLTLARVRRQARVRGVAVALAVLGIVAAASVVAVAASGFDPVHLNQSVRSDPAAFVLLGALAVASRFSGRRRMQYLSAASVVAVLSLVVIASSAFHNRLVHDVFLTRAPAVAQTEWGRPVIAEIDFPFEVETLRLSPQGRSAAVRQDTSRDKHAPAPRTFVVAAPGRALQSIRAADVAFVADDRALVVTDGTGSTEVRALDLASGRGGWRQPLLDLTVAHITYEAKAERWTVIGRDRSDHFIRISGALDGTGVQQTTWSAPETGGGWFEGVAAAGDTLTAVLKDWNPPPFRLLRWRGYLSDVGSLLLAHGTADVLVLQSGRVHRTARSVLDVTCANGSPADRRLVCGAFDGLSKTTIVGIDAVTGAIDALAVVQGEFTVEDLAADDWLTGWSEDGPAVIQLSTRDQMDIGALDPAVYATIATGSVLGTIGTKGRGSAVRTYALDR